jgi:formamidopyrimidine-DNA glycosylase
MPELPEVETIRRVLQEVVPGQRIISLEINRPKMLRGQPLSVFREGLLGQEILSVAQRGTHWCPHCQS